MFGAMAIMRVATRQRATAMEVKVMALLVGPRFLSGKLQLMEVTFSAAEGSLGLAFEGSIRERYTQCFADGTVRLPTFLPEVIEVRICTEALHAEFAG